MPVGDDKDAPVRVLAGWGALDRPFRRRSLAPHGASGKKRHMPVVNNRPSPSTVTPTAATTATAATATTPATGTTATPAGTPVAGGTVPAGGGNVVNARRVVIGGLGTATNNATGTANRFARDTSFDTYSAAGAGPVGRGFIRCDATPIAGGCRLNVQSFHGAHNDAVTLYLLAEVMDTKTNQLRTITLSVLANNENLNGATYRGNHHFDISYDDVNTWLKQRNPNLQLTPGHTSLAVAARWSIGHQAGGFGRGGVFRLPVAQAAQSAVSVRASSAAGAKDDADLPLDMQVAFPAQLVQQVPQLKTDGNILTRLESEMKGGTDKASMVKAVDTMYRLAAQVAAGDKKEVEKLLGKDWTIETVNRYWLKDDGSAGQEGKAGTGFFKGFRVDDNGLPIQDPMKDTYMDDGNLRMTRHEGAIRLRTNAAATVVNVKPGGGRTDDKSRITQRIEVGIELQPNTNVADTSRALQTLQSGQFSGTIFNHAQKQVHALDPNLNLSQCLVPWLDVVQDRHKFTIKNEKTGVEVEVSLDFVKATTTRSNHADDKGQPRVVEFCVLEAELDHLQVGGSQNQGTFAAATSGSGGFTTDAQQETWLKALSDQVTMDIDPRLHELKDLDNASFRQTTSYKAFEGINKKLVPALFPKGLEPGRQKAAAAAEMLGFVLFDDKQLMAAAERAVAEGGLVWNPAVQQGFDAAIKDPAKRLAVEMALSSGTSKNVGAFVQGALGNLTGVDYDVARVKTRVAARLEQLGLKADIAFVDAITPQTVPPQNLDAYLTQMGQVQDAQALVNLARALGVASPAVTADIAALLKQPEQQQALTTALNTGAIDPKQKGELEKFFVELGTKGMTALELRQQVVALGQNPQVRLQQLAAARQLTAPVVRADPAVISTRLDASLKPHFMMRNKEVDTFVKAVCAGRTHAEALQFVQQVAQNPDATVSAEAKRLGVAAPKFNRDWTQIEATLKPQLTAQMVAWTPALEKLTRTAIEAGVPTASMSRVFQQLGSQGLEAALKACGVYLVGVTIPNTEGDVAALDARVRQAIAAYTPVLPAAAALKPWLETLVGAGLTPAQALNYANTAYQNGKTNAAGYAGNVPPSAIPPLPVDVDAFAKANAQRLGALWTPAHDAFVRAHLPAALNAGIGLRHFHNQHARTICQHIATASGQALPAGL